MVPKEGDRLLLEDAYYKMHASCGHTHSALDALQTLMAEESISPGDVSSIEVLVYKTAVTLCAAYQTETETKAKFSLPFCIACMLHDGQVTLSQFDAEHLESRALREYAERIEVKEEPAFTEDYPVLRKEKVILHLADGRMLEKQIDLPLGRPETVFIENKYLALTGMTVTPEVSGRIRDTLMNMGNHDTLDALCAALRQLK